MENNILQFTGATYILFSSSNTFFIRSYFLLLFHFIFIAVPVSLCNYTNYTISGRSNLQPQTRIFNPKCKLYAASSG